MQEGDFCSSISVRFSIALVDFLFLNPQLDANCTNLWLNNSYCVAPVGNIATYSGYPSSTATYIFPKTTMTSFTPTAVPTPALNPRAPGTLDDCDFYENPIAPSSPTDVDLTSCEAWASEAEVNIATFITWNPSLSAANCTLDMNYSYCIYRTENRKCPTIPGPGAHYLHYFMAFLP